MIARRERPTSREISWVRPPMRPLTDSRSERVLVAEGSMAYSAVTQPSPEPLRHRGTPSEAEAAHSTRVRPNSTRTDPAGWSCQCRVSLIVRSSSSARPSAREAVMSATLPTGDRRQPPRLLQLRAHDSPEPRGERQHDPDQGADEELRPLLAAHHVTAEQGLL